MSHLYLYGFQLPMQGSELSVLDRVLAHATQGKAFKIMIFFPTSKATEYAAEVFRSMGCAGVISITARKSQSARTAASDEFRRATRAVLFTTDVSARGVDYPDVTLVVQV